MTRREALSEAGSAVLRVLDLEHLERQTFGDAVLEREVLALFERQLRSVISNLDVASPGDRTAMLHRLKGAARGVGAFELAAQAERLEHNPRQSLAALQAAAEPALAALEARMSVVMSRR